jgi:hypothetical protein
VRVREPAHELDHPPWLRRPGGDVAADHDGVDALALDLRQHGLERGQIPVDVVERGDAHC